MPADDDHDDEEDAGDGDGDEEHNEGRHTGSGSRKFDSVLVLDRVGIFLCHHNKQKVAEQYNIK